MSSSSVRRSARSTAASMNYAASAYVSTFEMLRGMARIIRETAA